MAELAIRSNHGSRSLTIRADAADYWIAELKAEKLHAVRRFYGNGQTGLADYFAELAAEWRGWADDKNWRALEGDFWLKSTHDGKGTIALNAGLRAEPSAGDDPQWTASLVLTLDAGGLDSLARRARQLR
jgi:hypothetical protein